MIINFPGEIIIDRKVLCRDLRLNIQQETRQMRIKASVSKDKDFVPVDIVLQSSEPKIEKIGINISVNGSEIILHEGFSFVINYDFMKKRLSVKGTIHNIRFDEKFKTPTDLMRLLEKFV